MPLAVHSPALMHLTAAARPQFIAGSDRLMNERLTAGPDQAQRAVNACGSV